MPARIIKAQDVTSGFLRGTITTSNYNKWLVPMRYQISLSTSSSYEHRKGVPEYRYCAVANCTCTDPVIPILVLSWQIQSLRARAGRKDNRVCCLELIFTSRPLAPILEGPYRQVYTGNALGNDGGSEPDRLCTELLHHFGT